MNPFAHKGMCDNKGEPDRSAPTLQPGSDHLLASPNREALAIMPPTPDSRHVNSILDCRCSEDHLAAALERISWEGNCWHWNRVPNFHGYGRRIHRGVCYQAHRMVYELLVGPVDPALDMDHLCRNRICVNPEHLEPVTPAVNRARGFRRSRFDMPADDPRHGTYYGYKMVWCRCERCSAANSTYVANLRRKRRAA